MAYRSGFFMSVNGDRKYKASFFAEFFGTLISNGVFPSPSTGCQVFASEGMNVVVKPGKAWMGGYFFVNETDCQLPIEVADGVLKRIDRIVLQLNFLNRQITPVVKKGTFASIPIAPTLQRDADIYEIALADVLINNGVVSVSQSNITDNRLNNDLCGIVHGLITQVDTSTIFNQYLAWFNSIKGNVTSELNDFKIASEQEFNTWFEGIKGSLEGDVATNLASQIQTLQGELAAHKNENATKFTQIDQTLTNLNGDVTKLKSSFKVVQNQIIPITGWSVVKDGVWRYDLSINGITTSDVVDVNIYLPSLEFANGILSVTEALTNAVRLFCSEIPTTPLQCDVVIKKAVV